MMTSLGINLHGVGNHPCQAQRNKEIDLRTTAEINQLRRDHLGLAVDVGRHGLRSVYVPTDPLSEAGFCDWIANAMVGQSIQYHEGFLLLDRSEIGSDLNNKDRVRLHAIARRAWIACELGLVHLFSMRVEDSIYRYIAIRSSSALTPPQIRARLRKPSVPVPTTHN